MWALKNKPYLISSDILFLVVTCFLLFDGAQNNYAFISISYAKPRILKPLVPLYSTETAIFTSVSMDYSIGSLSSKTEQIRKLTNISSAIWQLNRYQYDTIRKYDPQNLTVPLLEVSVAPETGSSNPHDVAVCEEQLFVSLYEQTHILVLDTQTLEEIGRIDISTYADEDSRTEASSLLVLQNKLYLALQGLDRNDGYSDRGGTLLEVDCSRLRVSRSWDFGANILISDWTEDYFLVSSHEWETAPAGLYSFHPETETFENILEINGKISSISASEDSIALISSSSISSSYSIHCFDGEEWNFKTDFLEYLSDIKINQNSEIWATAHWGWLDPNQAKSGIYRFDNHCQELDPNIIELNLAPNSLVFFTPE